MRLLIALILIASVCFSNSSSAAKISISTGTGLDESLLQSGNISSTSVNGLLFETRLDNGFTFYDIAFNLSLEFAAYSLKGSHNNLEEEIEIYHIKPKLRWFSESGYYLDIGLGIGSMSEKHWEEISFSGTTLFALSTGIGWNFGERNQISIGLVYNHYSNGYTRSPNPGLDFLTLNMGYSF